MEEIKITLKFRASAPKKENCPICNVRKAEGAEKALGDATRYLEAQGWPHPRYDR
jgi:hypothetical protein